jgi:NADH-quinone oxidoreductase subunit H
MTTLLFFLPFLLLFTVLAVYAERKISAFIQDRLGPMEVGKYGILQTVADLVKLLQKEDIKPSKADYLLFTAGPVIIFVAVFLGFSVLPLNNSWMGADTELGVFFLLTIISLDIIGIIMSGWGSNSKFPLYGAMRSAAQIISYEVPMILSVLCVVVISQSLHLQEISFQQGILIGNSQIDQENYLFGIKALGINITEIGGILSWNILRVPLLIPVFVIFFITSLAESNRAPFDLPEAESELIGGFHTEYSGFRWSLFFLAEYGMMLLLSFLGSILFLGSWNTPFPNFGSVALADWTTGEIGSMSGFLWGSFWLISKTLFLIFIQMWIRWTFPRLRVDQLMTLSWKYLTPASIVLLLVCSMWRLAMI